MIKWPTGFAFVVVAGLVGYGIPVSAAADGGGGDKPPSVKEEVRAFAAGQKIEVVGLDRLGDEAGPMPATEKPAQEQLRELLENYGYLAIWPDDRGASGGGLPILVVIIGRNGSGQPAAAGDTTSGSSPATSASASEPPPEWPLNHMLKNLALRSSGDASGVPVSGLGGNAGNQPAAVPTPVTSSDMAILTRTAMRQVRDLVRALNRAKMP